MPPKYKRIFARFLAKAKILLPILGIICLVFLSLFIGHKIRPFFWWSILFSNPLKETSGATNILLLGVPGGTHEGSNLTDTMIILSLNPKNKKTVLISLPRDLWSETLQAKINTAYHYGEEKKVSGGLVLAKSVVKEIVGLPIHYALKIDFAGFKKLIDLLGGVEIEVEREFNDYKFPIEGKENDPCAGDPEYKCRFEHIHFDEGRQILNGEKALEYVRSRNAEGEEGTDFARSRRQQKLILALKERIFSPQILFSPKKISQIFKILGKIVETDIPQEQLAYFGKMLLKMNSLGIKTLSLDEFLVSPPVWQYGQWVLVPRTYDLKEIQEYLKEQVLE